MTEIIDHASHLFQFDGFLHWCFWIAVVSFMIGAVWVMVRVLLPLRRLAKEAAAMAEGKQPSFDSAGSDIREIEQLKQALQKMMGDIQTAQEREVAYRNALTESQENERMRIAREIHDDTIQSLVVVAHNMERAAHSNTREANLALHLKNARAQLMQTIDGLRQMIANLRPIVLDELGLIVAIDMLCEKHPALEFNVQGQVYEIDHTQELAIFRAAQEAIHNAERHAQAGRIAVTLTYTEQTVTLEVSDNGSGFHIPQQLQEFVAKGHYGLMGMRERILHLGGQFNLSSKQTVGTRITVSVPTWQKALSAA